MAMVVPAVILLEELFYFPTPSASLSLSLIQILISLVFSTCFPLLQILFMDDPKQKTAPWLSVPQFGDWDLKGQVPDYSLDFSKIRENRKQHKRDVSRASIGNEEELTSTASTTHNSDYQLYHRSQDSPTRWRSMFRCFHCCIKA